MSGVMAWGDDGDKTMSQSSGSLHLEEEAEINRHQMTGSKKVLVISSTPHCTVSLMPPIPWNKVLGWIKVKLLRVTQPTFKILEPEFKGCALFNALPLSSIRQP